jgi:hypothetical protein
MAKRDFYSVLDPERHEIRVVILNPAKESSAPVTCELETVSLDDNFEYEALSYVWGDPETTKPIQLAGERFEVTTNLQAALRCLRQTSTARVLWVDAICIDQQDMDERSRQVRMMGPIYKDATQVVAFLGEEDGHEYKHVDALIEMGENPANHFLSSLDPHIDPNATEFSTLLEAAQLLRRGWWSRVWTVQETILAKELTFIYGSRSFSYQVLEDACNNFFAHSRGCCKDIYDGPSKDVLLWFHGSMVSIFNLSKFRRSLPLDLLEVSMFYRSRDATVSHDKIFAFLGLSETVENIVVDYNSPLPQCFIDNTVTMIQMSKTLDVFGHLCNPKPEIMSRYNYQASKRLEGLPSWVPDWRQYVKSALLESLNQRSTWNSMFHASKDTNAEASISQGNLCLSGLEIDRISVVGEVRDETTGVTMIQRDLAESWRTLALDGKDPESLYIAGDSLEEAFRLTMCTNVTALANDQGVGTPRSPSKRTAGHVFDRLLFEIWWSQVIREDRFQVFKAEDYELHHQFIDNISIEQIETQGSVITMATEQRRFIITEKGYLGLAPFQAEVGDLVYVLFGGKTPYILRKSSEDRFLMIGSSYIHGLMDGQAVEMMRLGSLQERRIILGEEPLPVPTTL